MTGRVLCRQCGKTTRPRRGRCRSCGAALAVGAVAASERRAQALHVLGGEWYWWAGELLALVAVVVVLAGAAPAWILVIASLILLRPASRLVMVVVRGLLDAST